MENLKTTFYTYTYRHRLVGMPDCAISVLFPATDSIKSDEEDGDSSARQLGSVGIVVIVVVVILIICTGTVS